MERRVLREFIEIYRNQPCLWRVRCVHYNNRLMKNLAYSKLVAKLREIYPNADLDVAKKKINALRTNYRKEFRKVEASRERQSVTGEPLYAPSLWYYELFHFIAEDQEEMEEDNNNPPPVIDVTREDGGRGEHYGGNLQYDGEDMSGDEYDEEWKDSSPEISDHALQHASRTYETNGHPDEEDEDAAVPWFAGVHHKPPPSHPPPDPQDIFGRYVASKLRQMDKSQQMLSERLVSEVLFRGQMGLLGRKTCLSDDELSPNVIKIED